MIYNHLVQKSKNVAQRALKVLRRAIGRRYRKLYQTRKILFATIYLEDGDNRQSNTVHMFGNFSKDPWVDRIEAKYDEGFKCFKIDKVRILIGH